ncbi:hypothetical protein O7635_36200 [Asanoa sp. WMMD1127]|uniref:hypothetical protein n=1 Tax=Asanoa sp. WMMD1127 TaxID=3016107 RepID=UPI0024172987|nr:hypothetical protein [Asanoa sp. WMMD1127]MDG4827319.1 hypothetical protein [Asanoa sp. WMMD1127]
MEALQHFCVCDVAQLQPLPTALAARADPLTGDIRDEATKYRSRCAEQAGEQDGLWLGEVGPHGGDDM